ncbi:hypothetical protein LguiB_031237 [Lonicera macranthoides]
MDSDTVMCQKVVGRVQRGIVARHSGIVARQTAEMMGSDTVMCQKVVGRVQRGLAISLFKVLCSLLATKSFHAAYAFAGEQLRIFQGLALLEIIHGAIGIVPNGPFLPFLQLIGRIHCLHATLSFIDEVRDSPTVFVMFVAWCSTEIIRYVYYAANCAGIDSPLLTYIRYSAFIVLYPIGVTGEFWLTCIALPYYKKYIMYADFFGYLPLSYYRFALVIFACYLRTCVARTFRAYVEAKTIETL